MSIIQDKLSELRYIKRGNLHEEAKIVGNYYRDIIHSYGIDCNYYKLKSNYPAEFAIELDNPAKYVSTSYPTSASRPLSARIKYENFQDHNMQMHAYGIEPDPDFSISAKMLTYMEVESDIFNLNKYGIIPNTDVNFYFDSTEFATKLSPKTGRSHEYKFREKTLSVESTYNELCAYGMKLPVMFYAEELKCPVSAYIPIGDLPVSQTDSPDTLSAQCEISGNVKARILFPVNELLYKGFNYAISGDLSPENICLNAAFKIYADSKFMNLSTAYDLVGVMLEQGVVSAGNLPRTFKDIRDRTVDYYHLSSESGKPPFVTVKDIFDFYRGLRTFTLVATFNGSMLFTDLHLMAKYKEKIVPMVGDVVTIDFPDENNRERYQITECNDKDLSQSGLNPLLHKYVWKCKARRYVNDHEVFPEQNNADKQMDEKVAFINEAAAAIGDQVEIYPEEEDKAYGGYEKTNTFKDMNKYVPPKLTGTAGSITILKFGNGSRLYTNGFDLYYNTPDNEEKQIDLSSYNGTGLPQDKHVQFVRASKDKLLFVELDGHPNVIADISDAGKKSETSETETLMLDSLYDLTIPANGAVEMNKRYDNFYKFSSSGTLLYSTGENWYSYFKKGKNYVKIPLIKQSDE